MRSSNVHTGFGSSQSGPVHNVSTVPDDITAHTDPECALQRAENLAILGAKNVLELCVGPSLRDLERAYSSVGITVTGNDIDARWQRFHPSGRWVIGDALSVDTSGYDAVVFAPPLTRGCTGKREDSLCIDDVRPKYRDVTSSFTNFGGILVLVLPARSLSTSYDREQLHRLLTELRQPDVVPLYAGHRRIRKYVDVYVQQCASTP
jgi:hypothetical protein